MKKIMFYCQYLTGMGHLVRSTEIVRSLVNEFKVYFVNGGPPIEEFEIPANVELISLPALWIEDGKFAVAENLTVEEVKESRKNQLISVFDQFQPDCLITEFFPFGRHKLFFEFLPLLDHVKSTSPETKIVCSLRDVIGRSSLPEEEDTICQLMNQYFDLLLFHSDPNFLKFAESFPRHKDINCEVKHTGFVAQSGTETPTEIDEHLASFDQKNPLILVSVGGGRLGYELLETVVEASSILEQHIPHQIQMFTGPFMAEEQFYQLQKAAEKSSNVNIKRYTSQFLEYMKKAELSISLSGYNTSMNILRTGVRSIVVPIGHYNQDQEQLVRTNKLEQLGIVEVINPNELEPTYLAQRIIASLNKELVADTSNIFDLQGAQNTTKFLKEFLYSNVPAGCAS